MVNSNSHPGDLPTNTSRSHERTISSIPPQHLGELAASLVTVYDRLESNSQIDPTREGFRTTESAPSIGGYVIKSIAASISPDDAGVHRLSAKISLTDPANTTGELAYASNGLWYAPNDRVIPHTDVVAHLSDALPPGHHAATLSLDYPPEEDRDMYGFLRDVATGVATGAPKVESTSYDFDTDILSVDPRTTTAFPSGIATITRAIETLPDGTWSTAYSLGVCASYMITRHDTKSMVEQSQILTTAPLTGRTAVKLALTGTDRRLCQMLESLSDRGAIANLRTRLDQIAAIANTEPQ